MKEFFEEALDFFEDLYEHLTERRRDARTTTSRVILRAKHAYHFTERVESVLKMIFGISIVASAVIAAGWGFVSVGEVVKAFVDNFFGRIVLAIIGLSYFLNGLWKYVHIGGSNQGAQK